jgi:hypothetical protein
MYVKFLVATSTKAVSFVVVLYETYILMHELYHCTHMQGPYCYPSLQAYFHGEADYTRYVFNLVKCLLVYGV